MDDLFDALRSNACERILAEKQLIAMQAALERPSLTANRQQLLDAALRRARLRLATLREQRQQLLRKRAS